MLKLLVLAAVLAVVSADGYYCGPLWIKMVQEQWAQSYAYGQDRERFGEAVWKRVFKAAPEARALFDRVRGDNTFSKEFRAHSLRVLGGLDMSISLLEYQPGDDSPFVAQTAHLNAQHKERGIDAKFFAAFKKALMETAAESVGLCFKFDSWGVCLDEIINRIVA